MHRHHTFRNSKGHEARPRTIGHLTVMSKQHLKQEFFMSRRALHRYFEDKTIVLGPWSLMSRWLRFRESERK